MHRIFFVIPVVAGMIKFSYKNFVLRKSCHCEE